MKRIVCFLFVLMFGLFIMTGCGPENAGEGGDTAENGTDENSEANKEKDESNKSKLEIVKSAGGAWKDSIDTVWVHSSAVFENKGDVPVDIGETQMNFKGQDDSILGTATMVYSVPAIVKPGETAFISETTTLEGITDPAQYKETTYNFGFDETEEDPNLLEVSGEKGMVGDEYTPYKVTGIVKNTTEELQDDVRVAAALYAEDGSLVGVLTGSVDVGINPGGEAGFELTYPEIPKGSAEKVKDVEVKAYGFKF